MLKDLSNFSGYPFFNVLLQLLVTTTGESASTKPTGGLVTELENVESRLETYPMLRSFLLLINNLCESSGQPPESLGAGYRAPGFQPYLRFIIEDVLLKFASRGYKNNHEKVSAMSNRVQFCMQHVVKVWLQTQLFRSTVELA